MILDNGILAEPISISDVQQTLGVNSFDLGTLCTSDRINPAARHKPTRYNLLHADPSVAYKANDGNCGLVPKQVTDLSTIATLYDGKLNGWIYEKPTGDFWKRLTDFIGYDDKARFASIFCADEATTNEIKFPVVLAQLSNTAGTSSSLSFADIKTIGDGYLGIYAESDGHESFYFTSDKKISQSGYVEVRINWENRAGSWTIYPIFSTTQKTDGGASMSGETLYTIPMASPEHVVVSDYESLVKVRGFAKVKTNSDGTTSEDTIIITIYADNQSKSARNFGTVTWQLKKRPGGLQTGDKNGTVTDFTNVAAGTTQSREITLTGCSALINARNVYMKVVSDMPDVGGMIDVQIGLVGPTIVGPMTV